MVSSKKSVVGAVISFFFNAPILSPALPQVSGQLLSQ